MAIFLSSHIRARPYSAYSYSSAMFVVTYNKTLEFNTIVSFRWL